MTGRFGEVDLNAEVRQLLRRTMIEINPDTVLLGESTNDAASDFQGDAWHGAMTYPNFTRPVWGWLSEPTHRPYIDARASRDRPLVLRAADRRHPALHRRAVRRGRDAIHRRLPVAVRLGNMHPLDTHDTARFATHAAPGAMPLAVGLSMTLPGLPVVFAGDEYGAVGVDGETSRTPMPWGTETEPELAERLALYRELIGLRRAHAVLATGGLRWLHADDQTVVFIRESADESVLVLASTGDVDVELPAAAVPGAGSAVASVWRRSARHRNGWRRPALRRRPRLRRLGASGRRRALRPSRPRGCSPRPRPGAPTCRSS